MNIFSVNVFLFFFRYQEIAGEFQNALFHPFNVAIGNVYKL